jgi:hypothetical protein
MADAKAVHTLRLIAIPAVITLAVTILRLVGELKHWPSPWFNATAGGGGALVGIAWLPIIFGPYFALKLAAAGEGPASFAKAIGFAFLGLLAYFLAVMLFQLALRHPSILILASFLIMLLACLAPLAGWSSLGRALLAYAFAARIPVVIVMYFAMSGNYGAGWGTHYDAAPPMWASLPFGKRFLYTAIAPQMTFWIGWTVIAGAIFGAIVAAIAYRGKRTAPAAV